MRSITASLYLSLSMLSLLLSVGQTKIQFVSNCLAASGLKHSGYPKGRRHKRTDGNPNEERPSRHPFTSRNVFFTPLYPIYCVYM